MTHPELTGLMSSAGYRPITLKSYNDLISGVRYVSIETLGSEGFKVLQFLPTYLNAHWDVTRWENDPIQGPRASYITNYARSQMDQTVKLSIGYDWYAKVADRIDVSVDYFVGYRTLQQQNRGWHFKTLEMFIEDSLVLGVPNRFEVNYAFNRAHPKEEMDRAITDIKRTQAELEVREAAVRQRENFAESDELRLIGAQFAQRGEQRQADAYFRESDALRRRIQDKLDSGVTAIERENVQVPIMAEYPTPRMLQVRQPPKWKENTETLEIAKTHKRKITLEED